MEKKWVKSKDLLVLMMLAKHDGVVPPNDSEAFRDAAERKIIRRLDDGRYVHPAVREVDGHFTLSHLFGRIKQ